MSKTDSTPKRILVVRHRYLGDTVLAIPALRNLRNAFPTAKIDVLVEPVSGDVLKNCPYIDELVTVRIHKPKKPDPGRPVGVWQIARHLRARKYDRAYVLRRAFSACLIPFLAGIPHRVGFSHGGTWLINTRSTPFNHRHEAECFMDVLRADGIECSNTKNENWTRPEDDAAVTALIPPTNRRRVYLFAKSTVLRKDWTAERFAKVCSRLIVDDACEIHACDAPSNALFYQEIASLLPAEAQPFFHDWSKDLGLVESGSLIKTCSLALGVDTGLMHIAASFGVPVVGLFSHPDPVRWHPWGVDYEAIRPNNLNTEQPLLEIEPDAVVSACRRVLGLARD